MAECRQGSPACATFEKPWLKAYVLPTVLQVCKFTFCTTSTRLSLAIREEKGVAKILATPFSRPSRHQAISLAGTGVGSKTTTGGAKEPGKVWRTILCSATEIVDGFAADIIPKRDSAVW
jgi:hypothetical protein